jgi:hypothetical protein
MRGLSRIALLAVLVVLPSASQLQANHLQGDCPLSLASTNAPATAFELSPHGVFRSGNLVHVLRGQVLTTYTVNELGDLLVAREDFIGSLGARESEGGIAFSNGFLYLSTEAGLEIYDLRNVRSGGNAPILVSRTAGFHYRQISIQGNQLAGVYPASDLPCAVQQLSTCFNTVDVLDISSNTNPRRVGMISLLPETSYPAFHDVAFVNGYLITTSNAGISAINVTNPGTPGYGFATATSGRRLFTSNQSSNVVGVVGDEEIELFTVSAGGIITRFSILTIPHYLTIERDNPIMFHPDAFFDETNARVITMIDEMDPQTGKAGRTIAFDVFDLGLTLPGHEGSAPRAFENVTMLEDDERKWNPVAVGSQIYVVGEDSGLQSWNTCGQSTGRIELDSLLHLPCSGAEVHGWVTGAQKVANVELFLDNASLGSAAVGGTRHDVSSRTPVQTWRITVNLDSISRGDHTLRAIATDVLGNRRQFASQRMFFPGPGQNCSQRRRAVR